MILLAVQYYFHVSIQISRKSNYENQRNLTDLGWEIYPKGIYHILKDLKKYNLPIYITENGLADAEDEKREKFIKDHLRWIHKAIREGSGCERIFLLVASRQFRMGQGFLAAVRAGGSGL